MNLDELKTTRRTFLKLVGAAVAGAAVPGLHLFVEGPALHHDFIIKELLQQRTMFQRPEYFMVGESVLTSTVILPHKAQGTGALRLFWSGEGEAEFGWWADYLELHEGPMGQQLSPKVAIPETVGKFQSWGPDVVTMDELDQLEILPGAMLSMNLYAPDVAAPWKVETDRPLIHGLELTYEA
ncbi:MAG TPA: twin-arginine translocation signal domain-containing protein [Anaerolineae bacterium]|nr:twin-arginine translocation signal domain-containing protein [Anaerolineae bacterium]